MQYDEKDKFIHEHHDKYYTKTLPLGNMIVFKHMTRDDCGLSDAQFNREIAEGVIVEDEEDD